MARGDSRPQIFTFASNEWDTPWWMARQHLNTRLAARGWPIVYSTGAQSLWERAKSKWTNGPLWHGAKQISGPDSAPLYVDRPGRLLPTWPKSQAWSDFALRRHARHLLRYAMPGRPRIAYIWNPSFWPYVEAIEPDYLVFHMHDAYDLLDWSDLDQWRMEQTVRRADIIIAVAENMSARLPLDGPERARILHHGVDFDAVSAGSRAPCPADLAVIPHPRIGYTGRLNMKIDLLGLAEVAERRPDWHWVFIGAIGIGSSGGFDADAEALAGWERLQHCPNVHFLGVKDHEEIPAYLHHMDALTLYYRFDDSGYWVAGYPTKLHEYLAANKPVVSSNLENVRPFADVVQIASTPDDWIGAIDRALRGEGPGTPEEREAVARNGDWNRRTDVLEGWLQDMVSRGKDVS